VHLRARPPHQVQVGRCEPLQSLAQDGIRIVAVDLQAHRRPGTGIGPDRHSQARGPGAVLICGRYEGIDQRVIDRHVTLEISLGDYVLSGGELAALVVLDAVARIQAGVLTPASHQQDSFSDGLLEGPAYTRPEVLADGVPVLLPCGPNQGFKLTPEQLEAAITPKTKWLIINSPCNPTGATYSAAELRGLADVLLHVSCLRRDGYQTAPEGARILVEAIERPRGYQAFRILSMDLSTAVHPSQLPPARTHVQVTATSGLEKAEVKWFNRLRGFGFVSRGEGTEDIFVHMETLRRTGVAELVPGDVVYVRFGKGPKGLMASEIRLGDEGDPPNSH
jgi:CspA family cold shock protein